MTHAKRRFKPLGSHEQVQRTNISVARPKTEDEGALLTALRLAPVVKFPWGRLGYSVTFEVSGTEYGVYDVKVRVPANKLMDLNVVTPASTIGRCNGSFGC